MASTYLTRTPSTETDRKNLLFLFGLKEVK